MGENATVCAGIWVDGGAGVVGVCVAKVEALTRSTEQRFLCKTKTSMRSFRHARTRPLLAFKVMAIAKSAPSTLFVL